MHKKKVLLSLIGFCLLGMLTRPADAQMTFKLGIDTPGSYDLESDYPIRISETGLTGFVTLDRTDDVNSGFFSALELNVDFGLFEPNVGIEYLMPRELEDINGNFGFLTIYSMARFKLPIPLQPYIAGKVGLSISRGDANYNSNRYRGVNRYQLATETNFGKDVGYAWGGGINLSKSYFVEVLHYVNHSIRNFVDRGITEDSAPLGTVRGFIKYTRLTISLGYRL